MSRKIIVFATDAHVNSSVGLLPPNQMTDDGQAITLSPLQRKLWLGWKAAWWWAKSYAGPDEITAIFGGDMAEGDAKSRSTQVISYKGYVMLRAYYVS